MQYSNPEVPLLPFNIAVTSHNVAGLGLVVIYLCFLFLFVFTSNRKHYKIVFKGLFGRLITQMKYYIFGVFKGEQAPFPALEEAKFNPLQQVTYIVVLFILYPLLIITGLPLMFPEFIIDNFFGIGGTLLTALLHATAGFLASLFLVIHLYFATMGARFFSNYKSIVNGYHELH
jgi:thiosulfate reductase cytochrome b subunit